MKPTAKTPVIMWTVNAAMTPAIIAAVYERGDGALWQIALAVAACVASESLCVLWRRMSVSDSLSDGSATLAGIIIGLSLPPQAPWHVAVTAAICAMALAKHCYGGLGNNPFNPAMAGYALAFVSFPGDFAGWNAGETVRASYDAVSMPTPLSGTKLGIETPPPSYVFPAACAAGGVVVLYLRFADWRLPAAFIGGALLFCGGDFIELAKGGLMLAAFFVITDPVTAASTARGRWLYGACAGALVMLLRQHGPHVDGIAFAILACNMLAPLMDGIWRRR